jgi:hypothetical protein
LPHAARKTLASAPKKAVNAFVIIESQVFSLASTKALARGLFNVKKLNLKAQ